MSARLCTLTLARSLSPQDGFVKNVADVIKVGETVTARVLSVDVAGKRLALTRKGLGGPRPSGGGGGAGSAAAAAEEDDEGARCRGRGRCAHALHRRVHAVHVHAASAAQQPLHACAAPQRTPRRSLDSARGLAAPLAHAELDLGEVDPNSAEVDGLTFVVEDEEAEPTAELDVAELEFVDELPEGLVRDIALACEDIVAGSVAAVDKDGVTVSYSLEDGTAVTVRARGCRQRLAALGGLERFVRWLLADAGIRRRCAHACARAPPQRHRRGLRAPACSPAQGRIPASELLAPSHLVDGEEGADEGEEYSEVERIDPTAYYKVRGMGLGRGAGTRCGAGAGAARAGLLVVLLLAAACRLQSSTAVGQQHAAQRASVLASSHQPPACCCAHHLPPCPPPPPTRAQVGDAISCFVVDVDGGKPALSQRLPGEPDDELASLAAALEAYNNPEDISDALIVQGVWAAAEEAGDDDEAEDGDALLAELDPSNVSAATCWQGTGRDEGGAAMTGSSAQRTGRCAVHVWQSVQQPAAAGKAGSRHARRALLPAQLIGKQRSHTGTPLTLPTLLPPPRTHPRWPLPLMTRTASSALCQRRCAPTWWPSAPPPVPTGTAASWAAPSLACASPTGPW